MSNTNCLAGLKCPTCGAFGPYDIVVTCFARVTDDGVDETWDYEWVGASGCRCVKCNFKGKIKDFEPKRKFGSGRKKEGSDGKGQG